MSFWQSLVESYEENEAGLQKDFPLSTTSISNNSDDILIVQLDGEGHFLGHDKIEKRKGSDELINIVFPVTEESLGRTSGISPHPLFEQYDYLCGNDKKFKPYIRQLKAFSQSSYATREVKTIYDYLSKRELNNDIHDIEIKSKTHVIFEVQIPGKAQSKVWEDKAQFDAWHKYYMTTKVALSNEVLDLITGDNQPPAIAHPKKISNGSGNAKLISANDATNFTFRGRFKDSDEALSIGYESSQKAHQFLRYLIRTRGIISGEQVIITYQIGRKDKPILNPLNSSKDDYDFLFEIADSKKENSLDANTGVDFATKMKAAIFSGKLTKNIEKHQKTAIVIFDAATTGRLSIKYYKELDDGDYLEKIVNWHDSCKSQLFYYDNKGVKHDYVGTPSVDKMIQAVYGRSKSSSDEGYKKLKKSARERFIHCIFDGEMIPRDYVNSAVIRASTPLANEKNFDELIAVTCAMVRKYEKEVFEMSLERELQNRDYLFGRLLGAADSLENYVNYKSGHERTTTALRYMNAFSKKPYKTWQVIRENLIPYIQSFKGHRNLALKEIEEIETLFVFKDFENDTPLKGTYLLGYSCEKAWIKQEVANLKNTK